MLLLLAPLLHLQLRCSPTRRSSDLRPRPRRPAGTPGPRRTAPPATAAPERSPEAACGRGPATARTRSAAWRRTGGPPPAHTDPRSEEHTSELQSRVELVCRLLLEKK